MLFKTNGLKENTMDQIAKELGISKKTLYQQVTDRTELIQMTIDYNYGYFKQYIHKAIAHAKDPIDELIATYVAVMYFLNDITPHSIIELDQKYKTIIDDARCQFKDFLAALITKNIHNGIQQGLFMEHLDAELLVNLHTNDIRKSHVDRATQTNPYKPENLKQLCEYFLRGIVNRDGEQVLEKHINEFKKYLIKS